MICLCLVVLNLRLLQIIFLLIRIFFLQDLDVTLHLIGDSEITMQGRLRNLCHEELLITLQPKVAVTLTAKPGSEWWNFGQNRITEHLLYNFGRFMENQPVE